MPGLADFMAAFRQPADEFGPCPFWFLNDQLSPRELKGQLRVFKEKGVHAVIAHPRIGIPRDMAYLSGSFMDAMACIVETAEGLDMRVVLYDEGMYPSGSAHGEVVRHNPAYASLGLCLARQGEPGKVLHCYPDGMALVQRHSGGNIRGIHFGEDDGEPDAPPSADILNPAVTQLFIQLTHERYYSCLRRHFGHTIIGFFTDEPCPLGRNAAGYVPWTEGLEQALVAKGVSLPDLRQLFEGGDNDSCRAYREIVRDRLNDAYYRQLHDWCEQRGIALMGHPERSDDIDEQRWFHIPGQDLIMRKVRPGYSIHGMDSVQAKCSADAARHSGKRRNSNECFGVCGRSPWDLPGADMKWMMDWLLLRGVNLLIPHAFYYSLRPPRHQERPPDVGPNSIWWPHYRQISDYIKRLSFLMTDSRNAAKVAVLCESRRMPADDLAYLWENQVEFNYLPISMLDKARLADNLLHIAGYAYSHCLPLGDVQLPLALIGSAVQLPRDLVTDQPCPDLRVSHILKDGQHVYLCVNEGLQQIDTAFRVPHGGSLLAYDAWRDRLWRLLADLEGHHHLQLPPYESVALVVDQHGAIDAPVRQAPLDMDVTALLRQTGHDGDQHVKAYEGWLQVEQVSGREVLLLRGDDMVCCWCNEHYLGASLWHPHRFDAAGCLKPGRNHLRVEVTGSASNRYDIPVPYGLHA